MDQEGRRTLTEERALEMFVTKEDLLNMIEGLRDELFQALSSQCNQLESRCAVDSKCQAVEVFQQLSSRCHQEPEEWQDVQTSSSASGPASAPAGWATSVPATAPVSVVVPAVHGNTGKVAPVFHQNELREGAQADAQGAQVAGSSNQKGKGKGNNKGKGSGSERVGAMPSQIRKEKTVQGCKGCGNLVWESRSTDDSEWRKAWHYVWDHPEDQRKHLETMLRSLNSCYLLGWSADDRRFCHRCLQKELGSPHRYCIEDNGDWVGWMMCQWRAHRFFMVGCVYCGNFNELELPRQDPLEQQLCDMNTGFFMTWLQESLNRPFSDLQEEEKKDELQ